MAYSNKIYMKEYYHLRVFLAIKKLICFISSVSLFCVSLIFSEHSNLFSSIALSAVFTVIMFKLMKLKEFFEPEWDGIVLDKYAQLDKKAKPILLMQLLANDGGHSEQLGAALIPQRAYLCTLIVQRNSNGRIYKNRYIEYTEDGYNSTIKYFRHGETVRHHRCLPLYEKFDKSKERKLLCFKCGRFVDKYEEKCWHCGLPVLSEETEYVKKTHNLFEGEKRSDRTW